MTTPAFDRVEVATLFGGRAVEWIEADSPQMASLPSDWQAVGTAATARLRTQRAMERWHAEFLDRLPRFAALMRDQLVDVVPARVAGEPVLVYVTTDGTEYAPWVGTDPQTFVAGSPVWDVLPGELQEFQRDTHPGFGLTVPGKYGIRRPTDQISRYERLDLAELGVEPEEAVIGEYDGHPVHENEVFILSFDEAQAYYCVSPRFRVGEVAFIYYDDFDIEELWSALDKVMVVHYRNVTY